MDPSVQNISNLFNDIDAWVVAQIAIGILVTWAFVKGSQVVIPWLAEILPATLRHGVLNAVPILRALAVLAFLVWLTPLIFNVTFRNFVLVAGALSVAVGFAIKDLARSVIAGFVALFEKPYRLGDWIRIGEDYGEVVAIGTRSLQLRTPDDNVVTIPHDRIWSENISNANDGLGTLMCVATFYVARNQVTNPVAACLRDVAMTSPYLNLDKGVIVVAENKPYCTVYKVRAYPFEPRDQFAFITDMTERGNAALREAGIKSADVPDDYAGARGA